MASRELLSDALPWTMAELTHRNTRECAIELIRFTKWEWKPRCSFEISSSGCLCRLGGSGSLNDRTER
jgi:hypothetical protein